MPRKVKIGERYIGPGEPCFIIAEAGINHQGELAIAKMLIDVAVRSGADAVKFQKRNIDRILTREGLDMPYENRNSFGKTYEEHKRALELSEEEYYKLKKYCDEKEIMFLASAWDEESVDFLDELGIQIHKVASADLTNFPLLEHMAQKGKPIIISSGMAEMAEVEGAIEIISQYNQDIVLLQCTSTYPSEPNEINLNVMKTFQQKFDFPVGYSGHEKGIAISEAAVALGAVVIERHFTLDRTMKGGDHAASLEPGGLEKLIRDIRNIEAALGSYEKTIQPSELKVREKLAKSLVSKVPIKKGTNITPDLLITKGPGTGISPTQINSVIGKTAVLDIQADVVLRWDYLQ